jgi:glycosyltransferase involved in cell wall biosynthesis
MDKPLFFSVIIPTYNRATHIQQTLESVLVQKYAHFEIIVVDDGSTDSTKEVVNAFGSPKIRYVYQENGERGKARNMGMSLAQGDYITFLDSDDIFYPQHLELAAENLLKQEHPFVYRQNYEMRSPDGKLLSKPETIQNDPNVQILKGNFFSCIGVFVHSEVAKQHQFCQDRRLSYTEDWEYWLRLSVRYKFYNCNEVTSCMFDHQERSSRQYDHRKMRKLSGLMLFNLKNDPLFKTTRADYFDQIKANMLTLAALMKVSAGDVKNVLPYLLRACLISPRELVRRRTFAIVKHLILNTIKG